MLLLWCITTLLGVAEEERPVVFTPTEQRRILQHSPVPEPPDDPTNAWDLDPDAANLGQALFYDAGFSRNGQISCASCHGPMIAWTDGIPISTGMGPGKRHSQSLLNVAHNRWFFWDGRADTLWSQAMHPVEDPAEFDGSRVDYVRRIHEDPAYREAYESVFGDLPSMADTERFPPGTRSGTPEWAAMTETDRDHVDRVFVNCSKAIAAFERELRSVDSPFDRFVEGLREGDREKMTALNSSEQRGLQLFIGDAGCRQCHSGPLFTDFEFHNIGIPTGHGGPPRDPGRFGGIEFVQSSSFSSHGEHSDEPNGRKARRTGSIVQGQEHWGSFKTPSLRNVARTAPYMHQGQFEDLGTVLRFYNTLEDMQVQDHHQESVLQPLDLTEQQLADLEAFLRSLDSPLPPRSLMGPVDPRTGLPPPRPETGPPTPSESENQP
ncbi:MAG: cytochrome c peroxidase [Planctomycetota bacterium]|nr:cytochrome c peroxidase [Planctomycetota bacterium]